MVSSPFYDSAHYEFFSARMSDLCQKVFQNPSPNDYLASLSEGERAMFYIVSLTTQVYNGGLFEYLCGPYGDDINLCISYLRKISADSVADSLSALLAELPDNYYHHDRDYTEKILAAFCHDNEVDELERLFPVDVNQIDFDCLFDFYNRNHNKMG